MLVPLALALAPLTQDPAPKEARQFDFWVGEWSVQNRHLRDGAKWVDGGVTRARITPVLDGRAILEEWSGPLWAPKRMSGYSLRAYDPKAEQWTILLNWSQDGGSQFGTKSGSFRHGRGEFISEIRGRDGNPTLERYTFSDALADSCRWDQAYSKDGGESWRTTWIMEFSRTAPAEEMSFERVMATKWPDESASPHEEARRMDFMEGRWEWSGANGARKRLRAALIGEGRLVVAQVDRWAAVAWEAEEFWTLSYVPGTRGWMAWTVHANHTVLRRWTGRDVGETGIAFTPDGATKHRTILRRDGETLVWGQETDGGDGIGVGGRIVYERVD